MKIKAGQTCYPLPDDFDHAIDVPFQLVDNTRFEALKRRNPGMTGNPIFGCIVKGFDDDPTNRLYVWPDPKNDEEIQISYWPVCIGKTI